MPFAFRVARAWRTGLIGESAIPNGPVASPGGSVRRFRQIGSAWLQVAAAGATLYLTWLWWENLAWLRITSETTSAAFRLGSQMVLLVLPVVAGLILWVGARRRAWSVAAALSIYGLLFVAIAARSTAPPTEPIGVILAAVGRKVLEAAGTAALFVASTAIGHVLLRLAPAAHASPYAPGLSAGLGLAVLAYLEFVLGILGLLRPWIAYATLLIGGAATIWRWRRDASLRRLMADLFRPLRLARGEPTSWIDGICVAALWFAVLVAALRALQPEAFMDDTLVYHYAVPQQWAIQGRIAPLPENLFSELPFTVQLLYLPGLLVGSQAIGRLLTLGLQLALFHTLFVLLRERIGLLAGRLACALIVAQIIFWYEAGSGDVDQSVAAFAGLAFTCFVAYLDTLGIGAPKRAWLVLCGLFAGLAAASKLQAALYPAALGATLLGIAVPLVGWRAWRSATLLGLTAFVVVAPWYLKAWIHAGDPAWPWLYPLFKGRWFTDESYAALIASTRQWTAVGPTDRLVLVPRMLAVSILPAAVGLLPLAVLRRPREVLLPALSVVAIFAYAAVFAGLDYRFWSPIFPVAGVAVAWLFAANATLPWTRIAVVVSLLVCFSAGALLGVINTRRGLLASVGLESEDRYLRQYLTQYQMDYPSYLWVNRNTPADARVLVIGQNRLLYLKRRYISLTSGRETVITFDDFSDSVRLGARLAELDVDGLLLPGSTARYVPEHFLATRCRLERASATSTYCHLQPHA